MKALKRLDEDMSLDGFVNKLIAAYDILDAASSNVGVSVASVICDVLAFKYWQENDNCPNSFLEDGDDVFVSGAWDWFARQMDRQGYVVDKNVAGHNLLSKTVNEVLIDLSTYITHRHYDYENERAVLELFNKKGVPIYQNTNESLKARGVIRLYRRKGVGQANVVLDDAVDATITKLRALNRNPSCLLSKRFLYFDETRNDNTVNLTKGKINISPLDKVFVLAGLDADEPIFKEELKTSLGRTSDSEVKSTKFLGGSFMELLGKENLGKVLDLIDRKGWRLNFLAVQPFYFCLVDIIDDLNCFEKYDHFALKQQLFDVFVEAYPKSEKLMVRFGYPNVGKERKNDFLDQVIELSREYYNRHADSQGCEDLIGALEAGKKLDEFAFLQDEKNLIPLGNYIPFYQNRMIANPRSVIVFDGRDDLFQQKIDYRYTYDGADINWRPADSKDEPMLQVADCVANIIHSFIVFADRESSAVCADIASLSDVQKGRLIQFKRLYDRSLMHNPECFEYFLNVRLWTRIHRLLVKIASI